jgi:hypothetical protein
MRRRIFAGALRMSLRPAYANCRNCYDQRSRHGKCTVDSSRDAPPASKNNDFQDKPSQCGYDPEDPKELVTHTLHADIHDARLRHTLGNDDDDFMKSGVAPENLVSCTPAAVLEAVAIASSSSTPVPSTMKTKVFKKVRMHWDAAMAMAAATAAEAAAVTPQQDPEHLYEGLRLLGAEIIGHLDRSLDLR